MSQMFAPLAAAHSARRTDALPAIAVVIPAYRVTAHVAAVIAAVGPEVARIYVVDDCCPDRSGDAAAAAGDARVIVLRHTVNKGVGGATLTGYRAALADGMDIVVKVDGDGQMDPAILLSIAGPIIAGEADYAKGNRFHSLYNVRKMPGKRLFGNAVLSFMTKLSSGYWTIFDPTNGYTAIHRIALEQMELNNIAERYFFESDLLINLGTIRAVVCDVPMEALYADETSGLKVSRVLGSFVTGHSRELVKRVAYTYFLRDFNLASAQIAVGLLMLVAGSIFGGVAWVRSISDGVTASTGTVMLAVLPIILGFQLVLAFLGFDMANEPRRPLHRQAGLQRRMLARLDASTNAGDASRSDPE